MRPTKIFDTRMIVSLVIAWNQEKVVDYDKQNILGDRQAT